MYLFDQSVGGIKQGNGTNLCGAVLAVEGVSPYYSPTTGRIVWRYRSAAMLSAATEYYNHTVVLSDHPLSLADSYPRDLVVGAVIQAEWDPEESGIVGTLLIHDMPLVAKNGYFSHGVLADCSATPGVWRGIQYDEVINIVGVNHIASTASPRQGDQVRLLMDSVRGEYAVDPKTLAIALPAPAAPQPLPTPELENPMVDETTTIPVDTTPPAWLELSTQVGSLQEKLLALTESVGELTLRMSAPQPEAPLADDGTPTVPDLQAVLTEALTIQKTAIDLGVPVVDLTTDAGRDEIVGAIETAVGLTDSWDPAGLSITQRLAVCQTVGGFMRTVKSGPALPQTTVLTDAARPRDSRKHAPTLMATESKTTLRML